MKQGPTTIGPSSSKTIDWKVALVAFFLSAFWGGNVIAIKFTLTAFSPLWNAFWRLLVASPILYGWTRARGVSLMPEPGELRQFCILSGVFVVQITLLNFGTHFTSAAYASVLMNSYPIFTNVVAHFFVSDDRITPLRVLGLTAAFAGICITLLGEPDGRMASQPVFGNVICVGTALLFAVRMIYTQYLVRSTDPARTIFWQTIAAIPVFGLAALLFEPYPMLPIRWTTLMALLYQGTIAGGLAFIVWAKLLRRVPAGALSVFSFPTPIFGVLFSAWFFSEAIPSVLVVGVIGVVVGIVVVTLESQPEDRIRKSNKLSRSGV